MKRTQTKKKIHCAHGLKELVESACQAGDAGSISGSGIFPGEKNGNPVQYSCLGYPADRVAWWATTHGGKRVRHNLATKQQWPYNSRQSTNSVQSLSKYPWHFTQNYNKSKVYMETQQTLSKLSNLEKEYKAEGIILTDFKLYYKTRLIKTVW